MHREGGEKGNEPMPEREKGKGREKAKKPVEKIKVGKAITVGQKTDDQRWIHRRTKGSHM